MHLFSRLTLILACLCVLALPAGANAGIKSIWGPATLPDGSSAFPLYKKLGVEDVQWVVPWTSVAPTKPANPRDPADPAYSWGPDLDFVMAEAARHRIQVTLILNTAPGWANGGRGSNFGPLNAADFGDFAFAASKKYPSVRRFSVWSEAGRPSNFAPMPEGKRSGPRAFAKVVDAGYVGLMQANRRNVVIAGASDTAGDVRPAQFVKWMKLPNGKSPRFHWWSHNAFSARFPEIKDKPFKSAPFARDLNDIDTFIKEVRRHHGKKKKLWISEYGIQTDQPSSVFNFFVSRRVQARWLSATYRLVRRAPYVAGLGWYRLLDDGDQRWGLYTGSMQAKPAATAFKRIKY
ncbi:MAG: hypothetical protein H0V29_06290 [Thermoleophilaceae bacterium]|nr:hypothetical protein [Thermoleophilaceae bacterium]